MNKCYHKIMSTDCLYIFVHLPKSAGTTLITHLQKNFPAKQLLEVNSNTLNCQRLVFAIDEYQAAIKAKLASLSLQQRQNLRFIYSHGTVAHAFDQLSTKKPFYLTFFRDPAERIVSLYNYHRQVYEHNSAKEQNHQHYHRLLLVNDQVPSFWQWYQQKFTQIKNHLGLCTMVKFFQYLGFLAPGRVSQTKLQAMLAQFSFVGFTQTFTQDSLYLYHQWGVKRFFINQNISNQYFDLQQHPKISKQLKKDLQDDYQLYTLAQQQRQAWLKKHPEYHSIVAHMKDKQQMFRPWQQLFYGWPENWQWLKTHWRSFAANKSSFLRQYKAKLSSLFN
ncbi:MAG: hypothetical protein GF390_00215 [Candidatus Pacebacteria bacterium]|nr:hypothetical protein [Candidatus Paceibacterota bacterium]